jgi:pimeloyl-ACP methyl ester carboxylesterase
VTQARLTPALLWLPFEGVRAFAERLAHVPAAPLLDRAPRGDGHPVLVLPGFLAADDSTRVLRRYLKRLGYSAHPWLLGRNLGPNARLREKLGARLEELSDRHGRKLSLVGWSLGGIYARQLAKRMPERVRQVITLGSPFGASSAPPPVPATAIYSKTDGITHWAHCRESEGHGRENIEVPGSHCGLGWNALVLWAIADRLALEESDWRPFEREGWHGFLYR